MDDNSIMKFGKHKGEKLANVPPDYLMYLHKEKICYGALKKYIEDNFDVTVQKK